MMCDELPNTGFTSPTGLVLIVGILCLVVGVTIALGLRRRRVGVVGALLAVVVMSAAPTLPAPAGPASAAAASASPSSAADCSEADPSVRVVQTSTMDGLAPGIAPVPITGLVTNTGSATVTVVAVHVTIESVSADPASVAGTCDATDYVLLDPHMTVDRTVAPGRSTAFAGASIGFSNKSTLQDACQNATVHLLYTLEGQPDRV